LHIAIYRPKSRFDRFNIQIMDFSADFGNFTGFLSTPVQKTKVFFIPL